MGKNKEEKVVESRSPKSKVTTILLGISLFCVFSLFLLSIFNTEWLIGKNEATPNEQEKDDVEDKDDNPSEDKLSYKKGSINCGTTSELSLNNYNVKIETKKDSDGKCYTKKILFNDDDITEKLVGSQSIITEYGIFDKYLVYNALYDEFRPFIGLYNFESDFSMEFSPSTTEFFEIRSFDFDEKGMKLDGVNIRDFECDESYVDEDNHDYYTEFAELRMDYDFNNNSFKYPIVTKEYGSTINPKKEEPKTVDDILVNKIIEYSLGGLSEFGNQTFNSDPTNEQLLVAFMDIKLKKERVGKNTDVFKKSEIDQYFKDVYGIQINEYKNILDGKLVLYIYDSKKEEYKYNTNYNGEGHGSSNIFAKDGYVVSKKVEDDMYTIDVLLLVDEYGYKINESDTSVFDEEHGDILYTCGKAKAYFRSNINKFKDLEKYRYTFRKVGDEYYLKSFSIVK